MTLPFRRGGTDDEEQWQAAVATHAPSVPWSVFSERFEWEQGQHLGMIGATGDGKTTLLRHILRRRTYVVIFATKPDDANMWRFLSEQNYDLYREWLKVPANKSPRRVLWPDATQINSQPNQKKVFTEAFDVIYREKGWCVALDEGFYIADELGLKREMRVYWTQARSLDISFVVCTQRPAWVPVEMYTESTHLFFWKMKEAEALRRVSSLGEADAELTRYIIRRLERYQFLYVNRATGQMYRSRAPHPLYSVPDTSPESGE